jgi:hypothetical protein
MPDWLIVLVILVLAAIGIMYLLRRSRQRTVPADDIQATPRDFVRDRETSRMDNLSEEDRNWQAASLERDRARTEQKPPA